jgi:hypothetical protein
LSYASSDCDHMSWFIWFQSPTHHMLSVEAMESKASMPIYGFKLWREGRCSEMGVQWWRWSQREAVSSHLMHINPSAQQGFVLLSVVSGLGLLLQRGETMIVQGHLGKKREQKLRSFLQPGLSMSQTKLPPPS